MDFTKCVGGTDAIQHTSYKGRHVLHQWESFMLRWHISLDGCHGHVSTYVESEFA